MPSHLRSPPAPEAPKESVVSRLLIAPLTFISFLLSLALIDTRNTSLRSQQHNPPAPQPTTLVGHIGASLHSLVYKPASSVSPYAYLGGPNARNRTVTSKDEPWHWRTKQREQMKAEISDAFAVRIWVLYALLGCALSSLVGAWVMGRWALGVCEGFVKGLL